MLFTSAALETWLPVAATGLQMQRAMPSAAEPGVEFASAVTMAHWLAINPRTRSNLCPTSTPSSRRCSALPGTNRSSLPRGSGR